MTTGLVSGSEDNRRGFRRIVLLLILLVTVPTALLLAAGILILVLWAGPQGIVFGVLLMALVACMVTGIVLSLVLLRREAALSRLQLDFVSKVSHELRTPLTSIRMFADMLEQAEPDERKVCIEVLRRETGRLSDRIERLLDWGRMEAGRRVYHPEPDSAEHVIADTLAAFSANTMGRDRPILVDVQGPLPPLRVDRGALVDALVNLLSNADKYSRPEAAIELIASADGKSVRFAVRDHGVGIPRREHRNIFEKFYRVDDRLSRAVEGSGLGLAIVRHVAQGHGGRVEVESEPGEGSTFTIVLPRGEEAAASTPPPAAVARAGAGADPGAGIG
ncbi:MAG: two-component sensor histidine kinase [Polyangiaceae bacterium]|nr:two-component sensor histidine kinase [Polyangiaceae bacterium]